jgi:hypothetical protein
MIHRSDQPVDYYAFLAFLVVLAAIALGGAM